MQWNYILLGAANKYPKGNQRTAFCGSTNDDRGRQLIVYVVSAVLNGNRAATSAAGNHGHGLAAIAAQGEQKAIEFFVIRFDPLDDIFFAFFSDG